MRRAHIIDELADRRGVPQLTLSAPGVQITTPMPETDRSPTHQAAKLADRRRLLHEKLALLRRAKMKLVE